MITWEYITCEGVICEYKNCKKEVEFIQLANDSEEAYDNGKLYCRNHI